MFISAVSISPDGHRCSRCSLVLVQLYVRLHALCQLGLSNVDYVNTSTSSSSNAQTWTPVPRTKLAVRRRSSSRPKIFCFTGVSVGC